MQSRISHTLEPLTNLTSNKVNFKWKDVKQKAFEEIKHIVARNNLLAYPDFNKRFKVHTHDRNLKVVVTISQE